MKKVSLAAARIYMSCIERRCGSLRRRCNPTRAPRASHSLPLLFPIPVVFFSSSLSFPALSLSVRLIHVRVFRARLRFQSLDAEGRLIVAPFLSAAFTAAGNPSRWKKRRSIGEKRDDRFFGSTRHDRSTAFLVARGISRALDIRSAYFLIQGKAPRTREQWAFKAY